MQVICIDISSNGITGIDIPITLPFVVLRTLNTFFFSFLLPNEIGICKMMSISALEFYISFAYITLP